jgi:protein O-mannosyl-transferase
MSKKNRNIQPSKFQNQPKPIVAKAEIKQNSSPSLPVNHNYIFALIVGVVGVLLYANTYHHGYAIDDEVAINLNQNVQKGFSGISGIFKQDFWEFLNQKSGYYRPLPLMTFAIEHEFFDNNPAVSHAGNIVLYGITGFFVFLLLQKWFRSTNQLLLLLISLLFISHPIHTEVVANIKSRDEILSSLFLLLTLYTFDIYFDTKKAKYLIISCLAMYLAYLSKESAIIGLGLIALVAFTFKNQNISKSIISIIPFLIVTAIFFFQKVSMLGSLSGNIDKNLTVYPYFMEKTQFLSTFKLFAYYLKMCFMPYPLLHDYSYNQIPSGKVSDIITLAGLAIFGGIVYLIFKNLSHRNWLFFGLTFFMFTIFPALAFTLSRGGIFAERFLYFPLLGILILLVFSLNTISQKPVNQDVSENLQKSNFLLVIFSIIVIAGFSYLTIKRNPAWKDNFALNQADIEHGAENAMIQLHYANSYSDKFGVEKDEKLKKEYLEKSFIGYHKAIALTGIGEAYFGLGGLYRMQNKLDSAKYYLRETITRMPNYVIAYNDLGYVYEHMGRSVLASYYFNIATRVNPNYQPSQTNKANYLKDRGLNIQVLPDSLKQEEVPALMNILPQFNKK